eukprot:scaffold5966_cov118-Cylindrotheca_fusiformis.AAC.2
MVPSPRNSKGPKYLTFTGGAMFGFVASSLLFLLSSNVENTSCGETALHMMTQDNHVLRPTVTETTPDYYNMNGWKEIHVFYGDAEHISDTTDLPTPYFAANQWFSQYRQDEIVAKLLRGKRNGFFVDLASNDAVRISNTYALETSFGWEGICLEPNPVYWGGLAYRKCHVVAAVVGNKTMDEVQFNFPKAKAPKGGIVGSQYDNKNERADTIQRRYTVTLADIFQKFRAPKEIDYLSLDVEGAEDLVMASFPFSNYRFNILTVERPSANLAQMLLSHGYVLQKTLKAGKETLWIHSAILDDLDLTALEIDSQNYKYRENTGNTRIAPRELA